MHPKQKQHTATLANLEVFVNLAILDKFRVFALDVRGDECDDGHAVDENNDNDVVAGTLRVIGMLLVVLAAARRPLHYASAVTYPADERRIVDLQVAEERLVAATDPDVDEDATIVTCARHCRHVT